MIERGLKKYAHGLSTIYVHMSFKTKYSHKVFDIKDFREACASCFEDIAENYHIDLVSVGFDNDHVHLILDLGKHNEPGLRKILKGVSGKKLLQNFPDIKKKYFWGSGLWGRQYYCYSIGSDMSVLSNYIKRQKFFRVMQDSNQTTLEAY